MIWQSNLPSESLCASRNQAEIEIVLSWKHDEKSDENVVNASV